MSCSSADLCIIWSSNKPDGVGHGTERGAHKFRILSLATFSYSCQVKHSTLDMDVLLVNMSLGRVFPSFSGLVHMPKLFPICFRNPRHLYTNRPQSFYVYNKPFLQSSPPRTRYAAAKVLNHTLKKLQNPARLHSTISLSSREKSLGRTNADEFPANTVDNTNTGDERDSSIPHMKALDTSNNVVEATSELNNCIKVNDLQYEAIFLRDSCTCHQCVDPSTKQKNFQTSDIPTNIEAGSVTTNDNGDLEISWLNDIPSYSSDHSSIFPNKFFQIHSSIDEINKDRYNNYPVQVWDSKTITKNLQYLTYDDYINTEEGLFRALIMLARYGLLILRHVPDLETSVVNIAERMGNLRDTFYGRTWDVKSVPQPKNVAYTAQYLGLHMDLLYMTNPPGFQLLHCLRNTCWGGSSIFSDSFYAASKLNDSDYHALTNEKIAYHYRNAGEHYYYRHPLIATHSDRAFADVPRSHAIAYINYSPPFQAPFPDAGVGSNNTTNTAHVATALKSFASAVESPSNIYEYRLQEGECVIFNNRRVLHGRREFDSSAGERWFKGAYVDTDVFMSRFRVLSENFEDKDVEFLDDDARYIHWDIEDPRTGRRESDPMMVWARTRDLPQAEEYAQII